MVAHISLLIFCRQVISEAMRLFPPAPGIGRQPNDAMTLAGMQISVRTRVHIPIFALHRNVRLWDNPTAFDPDRLAADKVKARSRYAFLPFGGGPRVCIGNTFATMEIMLILSTIAQTFRFTLLPDQDVSILPALSLRPRNGIRVAVEHR